MLNVGMELESVQEDPAQPIELKKTTRDFNVNVDTYGVMRTLTTPRRT